MKKILRLVTLLLLAVTAVNATAQSVQTMTPARMTDRACMGLLGKVKSVKVKSGGSGENATYRFAANGRLTSITDHRKGTTKKRTYTGKTTYTEPIGQSCCYRKWKINYGYEHRTDESTNYDRREYSFYNGRLSSISDFFGSISLSNDDVAVSNQHKREIYNYETPQSTTPYLIEVWRTDSYSSSQGDNKKEEKVVILVTNEVKDRHGNWTSRTLSEYSIIGDYYNDCEDNRSQEPIRTYTETRTITYY